MFTGVAGAGRATAHLYALDAITGETRWRYQTGFNSFSSPALDGDTVYVGSDDSTR